MWQELTSAKKGGRCTHAQVARPAVRTGSDMAPKSGFDAMGVTAERSVAMEFALPQREKHRSNRSRVSPPLGRVTDASRGDAGGQGQRRRYFRSGNSRVASARPIDEARPRRRSAYFVVDATVPAARGAGRLAVKQLTSPWWSTKKALSSCMRKYSTGSRTYAT